MLPLSFEVWSQSSWATSRSNYPGPPAEAEILSSALLISYYWRADVSEYPRFLKADKILLNWDMRILSKNLKWMQCYLISKLLNSAIRLSIHWIEIKNWCYTWKDSSKLKNLSLPLFEHMLDLTRQLNNLLIKLTDIFRLIHLLNFIETLRLVHVLLDLKFLLCWRIVAGWFLIMFAFRTWWCNMGTKRRRLLVRW